MARDPSGEQVFRDFVAARSPALQRTAYLLVGDWGLAEEDVIAYLRGFAYRLGPDEEKGMAEFRRLVGLLEA